MDETIHPAEVATPGETPAGSTGAVAPPDTAGSGGTARPLPRPGFWLSLGLAALPLLAQTAVGVMLVAAVAVWAPPWLDEAEAADATMHGVLFLSSTVTTLLVGVATAWMFYGRQMGQLLGWRRFSPWQALALGLFVLPLAIVASEGGNLAAELLDYFQPEWMMAMRRGQAEAFIQFAGQPWLLILLAGCVLPGIGEEILCRGVLSRGLIARHGVWRGGLWTSLLFGAMHLEPIQSVGACLLGFGLQYVFLTTRSLAAPVIVHTANNALALILLRCGDRFSIPGLSTLPGDETSHTPWWLLVVATAALAATIGLLAQVRTRWVSGDGEEWTPGFVSAERPPPQAAAEPVSGVPGRGMLWLTLALFAALIVVLLASARRI